MEPFVIKHLPKKLSDIIGQDDAVKQLKHFILNYKSQKKKALLLYGPTGTGKTCSVYALAKELNLELIEINASDTRNAEEIEKIVGGASRQMSLFGKGKIILIDEIDGLSGHEDRGGISAIASLIKKSTFPFILTSNNPWDNKFSPLRRDAQMVKFESLDTKSLVSILTSIAKLEALKLSPQEIKSLARISSGDARAALTDLETVQYESISSLGEREKEESIKQALLRIFKTTDPNIAITAFDNVKEDLDEQLLWLDENLPKEYENPADLARAYDKLSKSDIFQRRIRRWQHWRFLVYINALITAGIAVSKDEKYKKFVDYTPTGRILALVGKTKGSKEKGNCRKNSNIHPYFSKKDIRADALLQSYVQEQRI